jgi:hypothetical protein
MSGKKMIMSAAALTAFWLIISGRPTLAAADSSSRPETGEGASFNLSLPVPFSEYGLAAVMESRPSLSIPGFGLSAAGKAEKVPDGRPKHHILRAVLEQVAVEGVSTVNYWHEYANFINDWQWQLNWHDQSYRFFTLGAWRFDSNSFTLNWSHSLAGAVYYQFGRANNLTWAQSLLMSVGGSFWWEYCTEWREVISINDQIFTGLGGFVVGEPLFQLTNYFNRQPGLVSGALGWLNPLIKINRWLDRKDPGSSDYVQPGWHDFRLFVGWRTVTPKGPEARSSAYFGFRTQIINPPDYGQPGEIDKTLKDTMVSEISMDFAYRDGHADETNIDTRVVPWGRFRQSIDQSGNGYSLIFGLGSSLEYFKRRAVLDAAGEWREKLAMLHLLGPVADWTIFRDGLKLRTVAAAYFDFSLVNGLAMNEYALAHDITGMKSTVRDFGYYYGFGATFSGTTNLEWRSFRAHGLISFSAWSSADFADRYGLPTMTNNAHLDDNRFRYAVGAGWKVPSAPLELFVTYEGVRRWGRVAEVRAHTLEKRTFAGMSFTF